MNCTLPVDRLQVKALLRFRSRLEPAARRTANRSESARRHRCNSKWWHKWLGLLVGGWLLILGTTGLILDHRDWHWLWQPAWPMAWTNHEVARKVAAGVATLYQVHPTQANQRLAGGRRGLWLTEDGGQLWVRAELAQQLEHPQIFALLPDPSLAWQRLWLATDDGIWQSTDGGHHFQRHGLTGQKITSLAADGRELWGVAERSRIFRQSVTDPEAVTWLDPSPLARHQLADRISLSRVVRDLHYGRGLVAGPTSQFINDWGGLALTLLFVSGLAYWALPERWRQQRRLGHRLPTTRSKRQWMRWLYQGHAQWLGLAGALPLCYLALTGVVLDHGTLGEWLRPVTVARSWLPSAFDLPDWQEQIFAIAVVPGEPVSLMVGTRVGLFRTADLGRTWQPDPTVQGFVWMLRRVEQHLFSGGMGSPNYHRIGTGEWVMVPESGHMPSDITAWPNGGWSWKSPHGFKNMGTIPDPSPSLPMVDAISWYDLLHGLHGGLIFHEQWKWVNDLAAVAALGLVITGVWRWWRRSSHPVRPGGAPFHNRIFNP